MKTRTTIYRYFLSFLVMLICQIGVAQDTTMLIEAESFQFIGGWSIVKETSGLTYLAAAKGGQVADAITAVPVEKEATYTVWACSRDYATNKPGTRVSCLYINKQLMRVIGKHKREGFYWENIGTVTLKAGQALLKLNVPFSNYARVDAFLFTTSTSFDPNQQNTATLKQYKKDPIQLEVHSDSETIANTDTIPADYTAKASMANENLKFDVMGDGTPGKVMYTKVYYKDNGVWKSMNDRLTDCRLWLNTSARQTVAYTNYYPNWLTSGLRNYVVVDGEQTDVPILSDTQNPYFAGTPTQAFAASVVSASDREIVMKYTVGLTDSLLVTWTLMPGAKHLDVIVKYHCPANATYSILFDGMQGIKSASNVQLAPMFVGNQVPDSPILMPLFMTPQPVGIVEYKNDNATVSFFAMGDPKYYSGDWYANNMGLGLKNVHNDIQPMVMAPMQGSAAAQYTEGSILEVGFKVGIMSSPWTEAQRYVSAEILQVKDYRKQMSSLNEAIYNMFDLLKDNWASGWSDRRKGFLDIESDPAVQTLAAHTAPLAVLSASILSGDEELYKTKALPSIEYSLSRRGLRWGIPTSSATPAVASFYPSNSEFNTAYYEGLYSLLSRKNDWIKGLALPLGRPRYTATSHVQETWTGDLAAYRLTKDNGWLDLAKDKADAFIADNVYGNNRPSTSTDMFYNTYYPQWFDLLDLYETTGNSKYYDAAKYAAHYTTAAVRSYPIVKDETQVIHPGNQFDGVSAMWWKEDVKYRLGYPRTSGDVQEKSVPSWLVSGVGLGIEQPRTLFPRIYNDIYYVMMNSWAPSLLRLDKDNNDKYFDAYARNAVIGRFANYPGYYVAGYTDVMMGARYPYEGPDISSIYYHHIPAHLAFTIDYLFTEAVERSAGRVSFPYSRQEGFVWFNSRIYGGQGTIDGVAVKPILKRGVVSLNAEEVNYLTAISSDKLWVILLNESKDNLNVSVQVNGYKDYIGASTQSHLVEGHGIKIVSFPLQKGYVDEPEQLESIGDKGFKVVNLGYSFGNLYLYRIRSPFGWDSIYGFIDRQTDASQCMNLEFGLSEKGKTADAQFFNQFPYEWTITDIPSSQSRVLQFVAKNGEEIVYTKDIEL